jgi:VanZ family protein
VREPEPWRNPRTAPYQPAVVRTVVESELRRFLRAWWPALLWAVLIFIMSTDPFSSEHTTSFFSPIIHWLAPSLTLRQIALVNHYIRKCAHFVEYFLFCLLLFRSIRGPRKGWRWSWGLTALLIAAGYSVLDEIHQIFVASRQASPYDSLLDTCGAVAAVVVLWLYFRSSKADAQRVGTSA